MKQVSTKKLVETIIEGIQNRKGQRIVTVDLRKLEVAPAEYFILRRKFIAIYSYNT